MAKTSIPATKKAATAKPAPGTRLNTLKTINNDTVRVAVLRMAGISPSVIAANRARFSPEPCIAFNARTFRQFPADAVLVGFDVLDSTLHDPKEMGGYWDEYSIAVLLTDDVEPGKLALVLSSDGALELGTWNGPESFSPRGKTETLSGGFELLGRVVYAGYTQSMPAAKRRQRKGVTA